MFNEKRTLLFLNHEANVSFQGKRLAYKEPEVQKGAPEVLPPLNDAQKKEVLKDLTSGKIPFAWEKGKDPDKNLEKFGKDLYTDNPSKAAYATKVVKESLKWSNAETYAADKDKLKDCQNMRIEDGIVHFYKGTPGENKADNDKIEIKLSTPDVAITTPVEEKGGGAPAPVVESIAAPEVSDEQKAALDFFKKAFPEAKPGQIRINSAETLTVGSKADLYLSSYLGTEPSPDYYNEDGQGRMLQPDNLKGGSYVPVEILNGFVIEAPKKNGAMGKFVFSKLSLDRYVGGKAEFNGWVEVGKLRKKQNHQEVFETDNVWKKEPEYTDEKVAKQTVDVLGNTVLYRGKGVNAGNMVRMINKGDKVTVLDEKVRNVGGEKYVYVSYEGENYKDVGWVRKDMVYEKVAAEMPQEVAFKQQTTEGRENADLVAKYYNRETGIIDFKGDKKAEYTLTISDLFPGAQKGDVIKIKHKAGGKTMEAKYDPDKEFTKWISGKAEKHKGTFVYGNGVRVEIWDGDQIVSASWTEQQMSEEALVDKEKRSYLSKRILKEGETYQGVAAEALAMDQIKNAFEGTKFTEPEKIAAYAKLLKKYQQGNTLFFVVPTPSEAGVPTAQELAEARYSSRAEEYGEKFRKGRAASEEAFRKNMKQYIENQVFIDKSLVDVVNDEDLWKKAWNGEGTSQIAGLDQLMNVLKHPIFAYEGQITAENARTKMLELIQKGKNDRVDFEDVLDVMKIYITKDGKEGDLGDFKNELEENSKIMKDNEPGMKAFEAKKGEGILKQTQIVKVVSEKKNLAESNGDKASNYKSFEEYIWHLVEGNKKQYNDYFAAMKALDEVKNDPDYQQWDKYRMASYRMGYLNYVMEESAYLLQALGQMHVQEFKATGAAAPEKIGEGSQKPLDAIADVFHDSDKEAWRKDHPDGRSFAWEDVVAGESENEGDTTQFGKYYDENAPMLRIRSRLNKYTNEKGELDGVERITEADTVKEFNRLMHKALLRLIAWKHNPAAAAEFINKYVETGKVSLPAKTDGETDEAYASRVTPMLTTAVEAAYGNLKINGLDDLKVEKDSPETLKQKIQDQKDLIKMGYYFDSRDEEKGIKESAEGVEIKYSLNPMIRKAQEAFVEKYGAEMDEKKRQEKVDKIQTIFIGGAGVKIDTTKAGGPGVGIGLGTGIDLGDGYTIAIGLGVDNVNGAGGEKPVPVIGIALRKGFKLDKDNRYELGVSGGIGVGTTGPAVGLGVDFTWPVSGQLDMKAFVGGSIGILASGVGGGIGIGQNYEAAQKDLEKKIGGVDTKEIDAEKDQNKKFEMIINNPDIGPYFRAAASQFNKFEDQVKVVLDLYQTWRAQVGAEAAKQNSLYPISGGGVFAGVAIVGGVPIPFVGPYLTFTVGKTTLVYRRQSPESKEVDKASEAKMQEAMQKGLADQFKGQDVSVKEQQAQAVQVGQSGEVITDAQGNKSILKERFEVDFSKFKEQPSIDKYNEALKPYDMKLVPDAATGLFEFQVFGALGNLQILADPGMKGKGLVLKDGKVYLAPGANPELFITREEFYTPFPKSGSTMNTIVTITDTPKRTRSMISDESVQSGAYLYRKAGMQWEIMQAPNSQVGNVMSGADYDKNQAVFEKFTEKVPGFDESQWKAYAEKVNGLPFVKDREPDLTPENVKELKDFSKRFLGNWANLQKYKEYATATPSDTEATLNEKSRKLAELLQKEAGGKPPSGIGHALSDIQMNFVVSELMDLSFSELEKAPDKRARFEQNLAWSKTNVILPFFRKKVPELKARGINITSSPEELADLLVKRLLADVRDDELGKPGTKFDGKTKETSNWVWSSVAGAVGTGLRGVPGYVSQEKYGFLGVHTEDLSKPGLEGDLAKLILEMESPLDAKTDTPEANKNFAESIMAKKLISMPGMWFVLGDSMASQAVEGMKQAINKQPIDPANQAGFAEFKKIADSIRQTQLNGGNSFIYNAPNGNSFEFKLNTKVADAAHARCGNASFGVTEDVQIFARLKPGQGMIVAAGAENVSTVSPEVTARFIQFGLAGVVMVEVGKQEAPPATPPPKTPPPKPEPTPKPEPGVGQKPGTGEGGVNKPGDTGADTGGGPSSGGGGE